MFSLHCYLLDLSWLVLSCQTKLSQYFFPVPLLMSSQIYPINTFLFTIKCLSSSFLPADWSVNLLLKTNYPACSNSLPPDLVYSAVLYLLLCISLQRENAATFRFTSSISHVRDWFFPWLKWIGCQLSGFFFTVKLQWRIKDEEKMTAIQTRPGIHWKKSQGGYLSSLGSRQRKNVLEHFWLDFSHHLALGTGLQGHISVSKWLWLHVFWENIFWDLTRD